MTAPIHCKLPTVERDGQYVGCCGCGETTKPMANRGAAGFAISAHVKKANGQPVFSSKTPVTTPNLTQVPVPTTLTPTASGYVLPASLVRVPSDEYSVARYKTFNPGWGNEGPGYDAILLRGGRVVANIHYGGTGGSLDVLFSDAAHPYDHGTPEAEAFEAWWRRFPGKWSDEYNLEWCLDGVLEVLIGEAELQARFRRMRRTPMIEVGTDNPTEKFHTLSTKDVRAAAEWALKRGKAFLVWDGEAWLAPQQILRSA